MAPSIPSSRPVSEIPKSDCSLNLKSSDTFSFSPGSTDGAGFDCLRTGPRKPNLPSRSKPRLTKLRRKRAPVHGVGESIRIDLGLNGSRNVGGEVKLECKFGDMAAGGNGSSKQLNFGSDGFGFGVGNHFSFGVDESESVWNSNFGPQESGGSLRQPKIHAFDKSGNIKQDSNNAGFYFGFDQREKDSSTSFIFGSTKNVSSVINSVPEKQGCGGHMDKSEPVKEAEKAVPDTRGKATSDAFGDSGQFLHSSFEFHLPSSGNSIENNLKFVFGSGKNDLKFNVGADHNPTSKYRRAFNFASGGKENAENGTEFPNVSQNGVFVFEDCKKVANDMNKLNGENPGGCSGFGKHVDNTCPDINVKFQGSSNSGGAFKESSAFSISNEMKKLNIDESGVDDDRGKNSSSYFSANGNDVFVFGGDQRNSERNSSWSSSASDVGLGIHPNSVFPKALPVDRDDKDGTSFTFKMTGSKLSDADHMTPSMKFSVPSFSFAPGRDNADLKSQVKTRSKKRSGKSRQRTLAQQLFKGSSSLQNHESPHCGSPMDFSPYGAADTGNVPGVDTSTRVREESAAGDTSILENSEKPHDLKSNSNLSPSSPSINGLSSVRHVYKKKYKLKVGQNRTIRGNDSDKENAKQEPRGATPREVCEHWRIRGNEAYHAGKLSKAEEFYTMGIDSVPHVSTLGYSMKPLLLCYSNRAATRMSLGRMVEAIGDCTKAATLDPKFLKVTLRAGNCYLVLGEVEDAVRCYNKCLDSGSELCLDRRVTIEAAEGQQKAKKVAEYMHQSAKLLQEGTLIAASNALANIEEALSISRYSEKLFEMKGEALCIMRKYDDAIKLCEQTLDIAKRNYGTDHLNDPNCKSSHMKWWRWHLQIKSHYHLGRLELALELIEKQEKLGLSSNSGILCQDPSTALATTIRELLSLKKSGNEAFHDGRYTEAVESYTAAISKSYESRPFMAVCFCNRAAAYQSFNQIIDAIADCSIAIALDENYQKAISRRATLYEMIRDYKQAVCDLQSLVSLLEIKSQTKNQQNDSQNRSSGGSVRDLRKARRRLASIEEKTKEDISLNHYLILGIKASDTEAEIKKAYRKAALKHHPDKAGQVLARSDLGDGGTLWKEVGEKIHEDADKLFKIIGAAYAELSDPSKRSNYDTEEELRNSYRDRNRNSNSGQPSTSYSSPYERGSGRHSGFSTSQRNNSRRYWYDSRAYGNSYSRW